MLLIDVGNSARAVPVTQTGPFFFLLAVQEAARAKANPRGSGTLYIYIRP
jgi:hypothetical protein